MCIRDRTIVELFAAALNSFYGASGKSDDVKSAFEQVGKAVSHLAFAGKGNPQWFYCPESVDDPIRWRLYLWSLLKRAGGLFPFEENGRPLTLSLIHISRPTASWNSAHLCRDSWLSLVSRPLAATGARFHASVTRCSGSSERPYQQAGSRM